MQFLVTFNMHPYFNRLIGMGTYFMQHKVTIRNNGKLEKFRFEFISRKLKENLQENSLVV